MSFSVMRYVRQSLKQLRCIPCNASIQMTTVRRASKQTLRKEPGFRLSSFSEGGYILLIVPITTFCLTIWQIKRLKWKLGLIESLEARFKTNPVPFPTNIEEVKDLEFRPVILRGEFDFSKEVYIGPRGGVHEVKSLGEMGGQRVSGVHVVTPFKLADRDMTILVNRGWYSTTRLLNGNFLEDGRVHGVHDLVGIVRNDQKTTNMMSYMVDLTKPEIKNGMMYFVERDLDVLSKACGTSPIYLDLVEGPTNNSSPRPIEPRADLKNDHLVYAITWFGICIISLYLWKTKFNRPTSPSAIHKYLKEQEELKSKVIQTKKK